MVLTSLGVLSLLSVQDPVLERYGLKPTLVVVAEGGRAEIGPGEAVELVGASDLAHPLGAVWDANGKPLSRPVEETFWRILDDRVRDEFGRVTNKEESSQAYVKRIYGDDEYENVAARKRTFALAFKMSPSLTVAYDVAADVNKTFVTRVAGTRPVEGTGASAYVGVARVLRPVFPAGGDAKAFAFRLEVPGGAWSKLAEFPFGEDGKVAGGTIDLKMRWQQFSDFRMVDDRQVIVDYKGYFFTVELPEALREMELEIVTNDPQDDHKLLPRVVTQHIRGEEQGEAFKGKDLFIVYGLNSRSAERKFTLRARPKRIVEFRGIPLQRG